MSISNEYKYYIWTCILGSQAHTICTIIFPSRLPDLSWLVEMSQSFMIHGQIIKLNEEETCTWYNLTQPYYLYHVLYVCPLFNHIRTKYLVTIPSPNFLVLQLIYFSMIFRCSKYLICTIFFQCVIGLLIMLHNNDIGLL